MQGLFALLFAPSGQSGGGGLYVFALQIGAFIAIFYFLLIRPQQKKTKEQQAMIAKLAVGDEAVTAGGMLGRVTDVGDAFVTIEVSDGVRIKVQKYQVISLVPKGTLKSA